MTLAEAIDRYIEYRKIPRRNKKAASEATLYLYDVVLKKAFLAHVGDKVTLHALRIPVVDGWLDALAARGL